MRLNLCGDFWTTKLPFRNLRVYPDVSQTAETYPAHELTNILHNLCGPSHEIMHRAHHILGHTMGSVPQVETE